MKTRTDAPELDDSLHAALTTTHFSRLLCNRRHCSNVELKLAAERDGMMWGKVDFDCQTNIAAAAHLIFALFDDFSAVIDRFSFS